MREYFKIDVYNNTSLALSHNTEVIFIGYGK